MSISHFGAMTPDGIPYAANFDNVFFNRVPNHLSEAVFRSCNNIGLFTDGKWTYWPESGSMDAVMIWLINISQSLAQLAVRCSVEDLPPCDTPGPVPLPNTPGSGLAVGFVTVPLEPRDRRRNRHWEKVRMPGIVTARMDPAGEAAVNLMSDLAGCASEIFQSQVTRRYVIGFTLCGSRMRLWLFDRLGKTPSDHFSIHRAGVRFVSTILNMIWMEPQDLGFDPTIRRCPSVRQPFITINRNGSEERIIFSSLISRASKMNSRGTTCWKGYREGDPQKTPLIVKDSWQFTNRADEGRMLKTATERGVEGVARHYYHSTVRINGVVDSIWGCVRAGLRIEGLPVPCRQMPALTDELDSSNSSDSGSDGSDGEGSDQVARSKSSSQADEGDHSGGHDDAPVIPMGSRNRVHRRIILMDVGKPIYKASTRVALLTALGCCILGYRSLRHTVGLLHRDISAQNLMINEDNGGLGFGFLIDLDMAIREDQVPAPNGKHPVGTRAFMAVGLLMGAKHCAEHDLESFWWVLLWICVYFEGGGRQTERSSRLDSAFDVWSDTTDTRLAIKKSRITSDNVFREIAETQFSDYYKPLIGCVDQLRKRLFDHEAPVDGAANVEPDLALYMVTILRQARLDPVLSEAPEGDDDEDEEEE